MSSEAVEATAEGEGARRRWKRGRRRRGGGGGEGGGCGSEGGSEGGGGEGGGEGGLGARMQAQRRSWLASIGSESTTLPRTRCKTTAVLVAMKVRNANVVADPCVFAGRECQIVQRHV